MASIIRNLSKAYKPVNELLMNNVGSRAISSASFYLAQKYNSLEQDLFTSNQEIVENTKESDKLFIKETISLVNSQIKEGKEGRLFAVIHVAGKQFKITAEDLIVIHGHWPPKPSDEIEFEKVLLVGGKDFTLVGRPVLPNGLVSIKATVIEKDLSHTKTHFRAIRRKQYKRINFIRSEHTMVRINDIKITGKVGDSTDSQTIARI